jgi:hypothetical protein
MRSDPSEPTIHLKKGDLFVFVHIPKTAGSTFKRMLSRQFPASGMPKIGPDYQASLDQIRSLSEAQKDRVRCLSGHLPFGVHRYFPNRKMHYVSFVRDPVDRTLSEYFFLRKRPQLMPLIGLDADTTLSPEAFLEHQVKLGLMDFQTRVLSGYGNLAESVLPPYEAMAIDDADAVIRDIEDSFALIGTLERFDESLLLMKRMFGWRSVCYISRNVARPNQKRSDLKQALADEIRRLNPMDCKLHAHFSQVLDAKIAERGEAFAEELRRFHASNRMYSQAWRLYRATGLRRLSKLITKMRMAAARS